MNPVRYRSHAKINWYLDVRDRRPDGFTNIETVFQSVDLWDRLDFSPRPSGLHFTCSDPALADPTHNLVGRAVALLRTRTGVDLGAAIHLEKRIPVAAGLAGGSGNAAAALIGLNSLWDLALSDEELEALARELGSDVPFCLRGGTVAATGRGEVLEPLPPVSPQWLVLVHPAIEIPAAHAYGHPALTRNIEIPVDGKTPAFRTVLAAFAAGDFAPVIFNRMESGIFCDHPSLATIKAQLQASGCTASAMSGSGPTVFGLAPDVTSARRAARAVTPLPVSVVQTTAQGVSRIP